MIDTVTILVYYFRLPQDDAAGFPPLAHAIRETWRNCGFLNTVIVANDKLPSVVAFAAENANVEVQVEPALRPGDIQSMSDDCNGKLYSRFSTPYVLVVQEDGYPLRTGLEEFVGKYDFIGAPYVQDAWWKNLVCGAIGCWVQNGGFSLRSRKICEAAAHYWNGKYARRLAGSPSAVEDLFYTRFLPLHEWAYRKSFKLATNRESLRFSWDAIVPIARPGALPFGFHRTKSYGALTDTGNGSTAMKHEITITHRVCPVLSKTACRYADKLEMVKACSASLYAALADVDYRLIVILDGCGPEYEPLFPGAEIIHTNGIGNQATFAKQLEILAAADTPFVFCSEDDYLYKPGAVKAMLQFLKEGGAGGFVTPIDHPDRYNGSVSEPCVSEVRVSPVCHWRECGTTCLTFLTSSEAFKKCVPVFKTYVGGEQDSVTWLGITKYGLFSPVVLYRSLISFIGRCLGKDVWFGKFIPLMAWYRHKFRLLAGRRYRLWSPMPSLAFHLSSNTVPPCGSDAIFRSGEATV